MFDSKNVGDSIRIPSRGDFVLRLVNYEREVEALRAKLAQPGAVRSVARTNRLNDLEDRLIPRLRQRTEALEQNHGFAESPRLETVPASA